jgi:hypothetical protein
MAEDKMNPASDSLERRIILALEAVPRPAIPADFAVRVTSQLPPRGELVLTPRRYGQRAAVACLLVLLVLMLALAPRATGNSVYWFSMELIFCAQFVALAIWLVARDYTSASSF